MMYLIIMNILQCLALGFLYYQHYNKTKPTRVVTKNILPSDFKVKIEITPPSNGQKTNVIMPLPTNRSSYNTPRVR